MEFNKVNTLYFHDDEGNVLHVLAFITLQGLYDSAVKGVQIKNVRNLTCGWDLPLLIMRKYFCTSVFKCWDIRL